MKTQPNNALEEVIRGSTLAWIKEKKIKNEKGNLIEFHDHYFLLDWLTDRSKIKVLRKSSQVGGTTMEECEEYHDLLYLGINQIHTFPTDTDVEEFVPTKADKFIEENKIILDRSNTGIKGYGKGFLYYQGTFAKSAPIIISSDKNIYDEVDKSKAEVINGFSSRLLFSKFKREVYLSTPTIADFGIDHMFGLSDQKHWRFNCPHCNHRQFMDWELNVDFDNKIYWCQRCHKEITHDDMRGGAWEARFPGRDISGYWVNQMMAPWLTAADLITDRKKLNNDEEFFNTRLGLPYVSPDKKIPEGLILRNLINIKNDEKDCVMGVDIGEHVFHVFLGNAKGVFGIAQVKERESDGDDLKERRAAMWNRLGELLEVYDVRICIIDSRPLTNEALEFAGRYPYKVFLHFHESRRKELEMATFGDETDFQAKPKDFEDEIKIISDINRVQDWAVSGLRKGEVKFNFQSGDYRIIAFISHLKTMYVQKLNDKQGNEFRQWATTGANHYWDAFCEWKLALYKLIKNGQ